MQNYKKTVQEIFDLQIFAIKLGLDNIKYLCNELGNPHTAYPVIHVAGTNGKGSTSFFIATILQAMGLKVGLFTSPHLVDFRERITVNGQKIDKNFILSFWAEQKEHILHRKATFFDTTTALAFSYFMEKRVDVAIIETGLGGRLDSTNIVKPRIAVITPIHFDHEKQLGNSLAQIAEEKAGIIKPDSVVFSAEQQPEALAVLQNKLQATNKFIYLPEAADYTSRDQNLEHSLFDLHDIQRDTVYDSVKSLQLGSIQTENQALAYLVSREYLGQHSLPFSEHKFRKALAEHIWPGRLQRISKNPTVFFDVSHNIIGIRRTLEFLNTNIEREKLQVLVGLVEDKDHLAIAKVLTQYAARITITEPDSHRSLKAEIFYNSFEGTGNTPAIIKDLSDAYETSLEELIPGNVLLVIGSHYLIGSLLAGLN